jgi:hypothetical protein
MRKQTDLYEDVLNLGSFKNPVCQETFESLPRIYGSIKSRILFNKQQFYVHLNKRPSPKLLKSQGKSNGLNATKNSTKKHLKKR